MDHRPSCLWVKTASTCEISSLTLITLRSGGHRGYSRRPRRRCRGRGIKLCSEKRRGRAKRRGEEAGDGNYGAGRYWGADKGSEDAIWRTEEQKKNEEKITDAHIVVRVWKWCQMGGIEGTTLVCV